MFVGPIINAARGIANTVNNVLVSFSNNFMTALNPQITKSYAAGDYDYIVRGKSHICFVIGGSLGLHPSVCKRADLALSFSKMTFPHQLMRVILCEQIYRAFRIIQHEPYHK